MDPEGYFSGNTLTVSWKPVAGSVNYSLAVERCDDNNVCDQIFHRLISDSFLRESSSYFEQCTFYNVKVVAVSADNRTLLKETALFRKESRECDRLFHVGMTVVLVVIGLLIVCSIGALVYYHKKRPIQRIQRVRSKVYARLYSKSQYERPIARTEFARKAKELLDDETSLPNEFDQLEQISFDTIQRKTSVSNSAINRRRNRYHDIAPYDANRIRLQKPIKLDQESEASDFINASAISSYTGRPLCYIAAQGPGDETTALFWEMVWQHNVRVIVMLTNLVEGFGFNSVKCSQYWPDGGVGTFRRFGDVEVQLYDSQEAPEYTVRKLDASKRMCGSESREIVHIQYTAWPDRSAPEEARALLQLLMVTRALANQYNGTIGAPWLVHCSAGVGRTGTFIAVDQLLRLADDRSFGYIDVFNHIYNLRRERRHMVQTAGQYAYIYKCLWEHLKTGENGAHT